MALREQMDLEDAMLYVRIAKRGSSDIPISRESLRCWSSLPRSPVPSSSRTPRGPGRSSSASRCGPLQGPPCKAKIDPTGVAFHTFRRSFIALVERLPGISYSLARDLGRHGHTSVTDRYLRPPREDLR